MWHLVVCLASSRPVLQAMSRRSAHVVVSSWCARPWTSESSVMYEEMRRMEGRLDSMNRNAGIVGLVSPFGAVCAIATFETPPPATPSQVQVVVRDIACEDYESGSVLMRTITRTPGVGCAPDLPQRWRVAHAFYSSVR